MRIGLGTVLELTAQSARALALAGEYPAAVLQVPAEAGDLPVMLRTAVTVFGEHALGEKASGITMPLRLDRFAGARRIGVRYAAGPQPGFRCERIGEG